MHIIADLQIHSRFSRAVSKDMTLPYVAAWATRKGIGVVATGDWTHPVWLREIERDLEETGNGLLRLKTSHSASSLVRASESREAVRNKQNPNPGSGNPYFLLATEVSSIYTQGGKGRRVHTLIWVSTLESARKISQEMTRRGCNLLSDGRPIIPLSCIQIAELVFSIDADALVIPAHAWTPWFSVYGGMSGFASIDEAFGQYAKNIRAVETGLSSSPAMNWQVTELDNLAIVSFSDAHSGPKLGREATVFETDDQLPDFSFRHISDALSASPPEGGQKPRARISYTIEFHPEEGKYHWSGHRSCKVRLTPEQSLAKGTTCPVCGKPLTQGVMQRVGELAGRSEESLGLKSVASPDRETDREVRFTGSDAYPDRPPYVMLVPLAEIIAECIGSPPTSTRVSRAYLELTDAFGGEFTVLLTVPVADIAKHAGDRIAAGIRKVRTGDIVVDPGYDGVFGVVKIWREGEEKPLVDASKEQLSMF
ncbi:hypothetical protein A2Z33_03415 [Candidatus Gottesmanbacteria bacterium RBG_16_52_11]|uniref:DNA helicase UvrD n=1 Tax=Candidatus Gottesmanbacteria bacterium RBG_16_52_11 TaxID=1798374 RepID=A0A1F5YVE0_9BACT|nr:MAG: hypothetical protein A2Z33_03415 [Candidatus Gottesmanbacteria bacterium RBG_16_52_11]